MEENLLSMKVGRSFDSDISSRFIGTPDEAARLDVSHPSSDLLSAMRVW